MNPKYIGVGVLVLAIIGLAYLQLNMKNEPNSTSPEDAQPTVAVKSEDRKYKNGTFSAKGNYTSPAGEEEIGVTITLEGGVIASTDVQTVGKTETSKKMQGLFKGGYKQLVVGKPIDQVKLDVVAGSSLTPKGFKDALEKIKKEAAV